MARFVGSTWLGNGVSGGSRFAGKPKFVIHITITKGLPGYNNGLKAPHFTDHPADGRTYQHTDTSIASRALQNRAGGVETNRAGPVIQLEIVAYESRAKADRYGGIWIGDLTDTDYERIARLVRWAHEKEGVPYSIRTPRIKPLGEIGAGPPRMTAQEWSDFSGICGHFEVPENDPKWDPCAFDFERLLTHLTPEPLPPIGDDDMQLYEQWVRALAVRDGFGTRNAGKQRLVEYNQAGLIGDPISYWTNLLDQVPEGDEGTVDPVWRQAWVALETQRDINIKKSAGV